MPNSASELPKRGGGMFLAVTWIDIEGTRLPVCVPWQSEHPGADFRSPLHPRWREPRAERVR